MSEILLKKIVPLHPFRIPIRDKERIKALLYKLEVQMFGWNLPHLFHIHLLGIDKSLPEEYHRTEMIRLIAVLLSGDNEELIDDPSAVFDEEKTDAQFFSDFQMHFVTELKSLLCDNSDVTFKAFGTRTYAQEIHSRMMSIIYSKIGYRNPAIPGITAFTLLVLANLYPKSFCTTPTPDIIKSLAHRIDLRARPLA
jgi:hypothetical protein